jgi:hypothetical protein
LDAQVCRKSRLVPRNAYGQQELADEGIVDQVPVDTAITVSWAPVLDPLLGESPDQLDLNVKLCLKASPSLLEPSMNITLSLNQPTTISL